MLRRIPLRAASSTARMSQLRRHAPDGQGAALLGGADNDVRNGLVQPEVAAAQRQHIVDAPAGIPQRVDQRVLRPVGHVMEQGGNLRRQQVAWQVGVGRGHGAKPQRAPVVGLAGRLGRKAAEHLKRHRTPCFLAALREFCRGLAPETSQNSRSDAGS